MIKSLAAVALCGWTACGAAMGQAHSAAAEFGAASNPAGVWSYGLRPGGPGTFELFADTFVAANIDFWHRDLPFPGSYPAIGHNGTAETQFWGGPSGPVAAGELVMHPGDLPAVLRFTAPVAGAYQVAVAARVTATCAGNIGVSLWSGAAQLDGTTMIGHGAQWTTARLVQRLAGESIDLLMSSGGDGINCDHTGVTMVVALQGCGPADVGGTGGVVGADGALNNNDFVVFIDWFFASDTRADRGGTGGVPGADGQWNNNDFVVFIDQFFDGCDA